MKLKITIAVIALALIPAAGVLAQTPEYPLQAKIVAVEMQTGASVRAPYTYTSFGKEYTVGGGGGTYEWHLMKTVIGDKLYGLSSTNRRHWLHTGTYPAKPVKNGFQLQYTDDKGKVRHEVLRIKSEEPAPVQ